MKTPRRKRTPSKAPVPRLTITLEHFAGIKRQVWVGTPRDFAMSWPVEVNPLMGERTCHLVSTPHSIDFKATMSYLGAIYRSDHS